MSVASEVILTERRASLHLDRTTYWLSALRKDSLMGYHTSLEGYLVQILFELISSKTHLDIK